MKLSASTRGVISWTAIITLITGLLPVLSQFLPLIMQLLNTIIPHKAALVGGSAAATGSGLWLLCDYASRKLAGRDAETDAEADANAINSALVKVAASDAPGKDAALDLLSRANLAYLGVCAPAIKLERAQSAENRASVEDEFKRAAPQLLALLRERLQPKQ